MQKRSVLDIVTKELLTPKGIRSLSPKSEGYHPYCTGPQAERDLAYHQGTAWPWLLGFYLEAYLRLRKVRCGIRRTYAHQYGGRDEQPLYRHPLGNV